MSPSPLTKYDLQLGLQCNRRLWWMRSEEDTPKPPFPQGLRAQKRQLVDVYLAENPVSPMTTVTAQQWGQRVQATTDLMATRSSVIHQACFAAGNFRWSCDLLTPEEDGWSVREFRSIANIRSRHITAAAMVTWGLRRLDIPVTHYRLSTINTEWNGIDPEPRFLDTDILESADRRLQDIAEELSCLIEDEPSEVPPPSIGSHCQKPTPCPFHARCHGTESRSDLNTLYRVKKKVLKQLTLRDIDRIEDIPDDVPLPPIARRQREAVMGNRTVISEDLGPALDSISRPTIYIDFEAIQPSLPPWEGCRPFGAIPVQVSLHKLDKAGEVSHSEWLASPLQDPRPGLAEFLATHLKGAATLVAYHATFEQNIISRLAPFCSTDGANVLKIANDSFVDLLPLVRNHVYHPAFRGRFNLKCVVQALLPELSYQDLKVQRGDEASRLLEALLLGQDAASIQSEVEDIRKALLSYCERDTWVMVRLEALLRDLAGES